LRPLRACRKRDLREEFADRLLNVTAQNAAGQKKVVVKTSSFQRRKGFTARSFVFCFVEDK